MKLISADEADPVIGYLTLIETSEGVYVTGKIVGLKKGLHGFHVHQKGDLGNGCKNSGGHFNPFEVQNTTQFRFEFDIQFFAENSW